MRVLSMCRALAAGRRGSSHRSWVRALLLAAATASSGCAGDGPAPSGAGGTFDTVQEIFQRTCLDAGCHNSTDRAEGLVLERGLAYGALVDVLPTNAAARAAGLLRVVPNDPDRSLLLIKLLNPPSQLGTRMPQGKPALSDSDIALVRAWINEGAPAPSQPEFTASASATITVTATPSESATRTPSASVTPTTTISPTATISPTGTLPPSPTVTLTATRTPTASASASASPTASPTILPGSTFNEIQQNIFSPSCLNEGCHNFNDQAGGQILDSTVAYEQLVGVTSTNFNALMRGLLRVKPGDPDNSFLYIKIALPGAFDATFGARMPQATPALPAQQIEQVRAWIERGALLAE